MKRQLYIALVAVLFWCGCTTEHYAADAQHPEIAITPAGGVTFRGEFVDVEDLPGLLRRASYQRMDTIYIRAPEDRSHERLKMQVMRVLSRNGFTRPMLVGEVHSSAQAGRTGDERRRDERMARQQQQRQFGQRQQPRKREVRYK